MYDALVESAAAAGFVQYEIANFARNVTAGAPSPSEADIPSHACRHNVTYWRGGSYYGLGPSAAGYVRGVRTKNWPNTQLYCERLERGERAIETVEELAPLKRAGETAAFGLRMNAGWPFDDFQEVTGFDLHREWRGEISDLLQRGWGDLMPDRFRLTPAGLRFADTAAGMFLR
jgi:oxygen-independent coproporphyrinogen-3 oxidase